MVAQNQGDNFIEFNNDLLQSDLKSKNSLPSLPCILSYYPELHNFSEIKEFFGLERTVQSWDYDSAVEAGKAFIKRTNGKLTQSDLRKANNLPTSKVITRLFGSIPQYQKVIGANIHNANKFISVEDIDKAMLEHFADKERVVDNRKTFFSTFRYSQSTIVKRFESVDIFFDTYGITETNPKKYKYTKSEIDKIIIEFIKAGNEIPTNAKNLTKLGLPSAQAIMRYYNSWKEPFIYLQKMYEKIQ